MPDVSPKGSGDQSWPRWGSAFSLCRDPCFILRHSSHLLVQRRHFSNPQTEWVLGAQRQELRSTRCLTASFSARPAHESCPVPSLRQKQCPLTRRKGGDPPQHIACKIEKMQSLESSLLRVMWPLCFVQLIHIFLCRLNLRTFALFQELCLSAPKWNQVFRGPEAYRMLGAPSFRKIIQSTNIM